MSMWDVLVVGGGPAGSAAALSLRQRGARVLLVERSRARGFHPGESLVGEGSSCLDELGVGDEFRRLECRRSYLHHIRWAGKSVERSAFWTQAGAPHHVDRVMFDEMLLTACERRGVTVKRGCTPTRVDTTPDRIVAELNDDGSLLRSELAGVIDATGRSAWVCRRFEARRERTDRLVAFSAIYERGECEPSSLVEAGAHGWWYSAPRPGGAMTAMYVTELLDAGERNGEAIFRSALEHAPVTQARLQGRVRRSPVHAYRAGPEWTQFEPELPVLPVGDATLSFDPISGEGLCFALRSGIEAARAWEAASTRRAYRDGARNVYTDHLREREAAYALERPRRQSAFWSTPRDTTVPSGGVS